MLGRLWVVARCGQTNAKMSSDYRVSVVKYSRTAKVIDVLNILPLTDRKRCGHHGNVSFHLDSNIYKNVCQIVGRVAASNKVVLPERQKQASVKQEVRSLRLSERYLYVQLCKLKGRHCTVHFDLTTRRQITIHVSVSTLHKEVKVGNQSIHLPLSMSNKWSILCVDFEDIVQRYFPNEHRRHLKRITLCSNMLVCGIYASDTRFTFGDLPKQISLLRRNGQRWLDLYSWRNVPELVGGALRAENEALEDIPGSTPKQHLLRVSRHGVNPLSGVDLQTPQQSPFSSGGQGRASSQTNARLALSNSGGQSTSVVEKVLRGSNFSSSHIARSFPARAGSPTRRVQTNVPGPTKLDLDRITAVTPSDAAGAWWFDHNRNIVFPSGNVVVMQTVSAHSVLAPSANASAATNASGTQKYFFGHASPIVALCVSEKPRLIISAENGSVPCIRVWNADFHSTLNGQARQGQSKSKLACLAILVGPAGGIGCLALSEDGKFLCVTGSDEQHRQQLFVWNIANVDGTAVDGTSSGGGGVIPTDGPVNLHVHGSGNKKQFSPSRWEAATATAAKAHTPYTLLAKQMSEFPIHRIQFIPGHHGQGNGPSLISCGRENIRFWRVRDKHIRGRPVVLQSHLRKSDFLDIAFEKSRAAMVMANTTTSSAFVSNVSDGKVTMPNRRKNIEYPRAFVSSSMGDVVVVNTRTAEVQASFHIHEAPITALSVNEGYCVTASDDRTLKVNIRVVSCGCQNAVCFGCSSISDHLCLFLICAGVAIRFLRLFPASTS